MIWRRWDGFEKLDRLRQRFRYRFSSRQFTLWRVSSCPCHTNRRSHRRPDFDLGACASEGLCKELPSEIVDACTAQVLNPLMALGPQAWSSLRHQLQEFLGERERGSQRQRRLASMLVPMRDAEMLLP